MSKNSKKKDRAKTEASGDSTGTKAKSKKKGRTPKEVFKIRASMSKEATGSDKTAGRQVTLQQTTFRTSEMAETFGKLLVKVGWALDYEVIHVR